jgi:hypothetical protein
MKKIITLLIAMTMIFALTACGGALPPHEIEYTELLEILRTYIEAHKNLADSYEPDSDDYIANEAAIEALPWVCDSIELAKYSVAKKDFHYGTTDINADGIPELILFIELQHGMQVLAIFTIHDSQAKHLLGAIERTAITGIMRDGTIVWQASGGAGSAYRELHRIDKNSGLDTFYSTHREWVFDEETEDGEFIYRDYHSNEILSNQEEAEEMWDLSEEGTFDDMLIDMVLSPLFD